MPLYCCMWKFIFKANFNLDKNKVIVKIAERKRGQMNLKEVQQSSIMSLHWMQHEGCAACTNTAANVNQEGRQNEPMCPTMNSAFGLISSRDNPKGHHTVMTTDHLLWPLGRALAVCALLLHTLYWPEAKGKREEMGGEESPKSPLTLLLPDLWPLKCNKRVIKLSITIPSPPPPSHAAWEGSSHWLVSLTQQAVLIWSADCWSIAVIDGDYDKHPLKHI